MASFKTSFPEQKRILNSICRKKFGWRLQMAVVALLILCSAATLGGTIYLITKFSMTYDNALLWGLGGLTFVLIPLIVAVGIKNTADYHYAQPYSSQANGSLCLQGDTLTYTFWEVGSGDHLNRKYEEAYRTVYAIKRNAVSALAIRDGICTVKGWGTMEAPPEEGEARKEKPCKSFSFLLAFEEGEASQSIETWKNP